MAIQRFFTKDIVIRRERETGTKTTFQATGTADGWLEDLDTEARSQLGIIDQRAWRFWLNIDEDVQEGDILYIGTDQYFVREVTRREIGINQHTEVLATEHNA